MLRTGAPWARDVDLRREVEFEAQRITEMVTCIEDTGPWLRGQIDNGTSTLDYVHKINALAANMQVTAVAQLFRLLLLTYDFHV